MGLGRPRWAASPVPGAARETTACKSVSRRTRPTVREHHRAQSAHTEGSALKPFTEKRSILFSDHSCWLQEAPGK